MYFLKKAIPLALLFAAAATAQRPSRIRARVDDNVVTRIPASEHRGIARAVDNGRVAPDLVMDRMQLTLSSGPDQLATLEQLLRDQQDPSSPAYHQWLTPQQFGQQFGPSQDDLDAVTGWLATHGFTVTAIAAGRRSIEFSGDASHVEQAFHTEMHRYTVAGAAHIANSTDISVPSALASVVTGIVSLNDFRAQPQHRVVSSTSGSLLKSPAYNNSDGSHTLTPFDYATIYDINPVWNTLKIDGTGQNIAVISRSNIDLTDVSTFRSRYGMQPASVQVLLNGTDPGIQTQTGDDIEASLDVEWAGATAKGANIIMVTSASTRTSDGVDLSAKYAVDNNVAPVITMSYGSCEAQNGSYNNYYNSLWQQAAAQGISVFVSSGDDGSAGCDDQTSAQPASGTFAVSGLASTPYNVAVGGSQFDESSGGPYWASSNSSTQVSSALGYIPEVVWNESAYVNAGNADNGLWASSGGVSMLYTTPTWQTGPGVPSSDPGTSNAHHRYLPDVSLTAADHDGYLVRAGGTTYRVSGTSASTPSFAGIMAMINQYTNARNGLPNPKFYALAQSTPGIFHDVTSGTNAVPCAIVDPSCTGPGIVAGVATMGGYNAATGYDLATGLGSVDVYNLVTNFGPASSSGGGTSGGTGGGTGGTGTGGISSTPGTPPPAGSTSLSGAHVATGGGWQTLIQLVNPTATPAQAHLRIYDDNGNTLSIPLVSADGTINTTASSLDPTLGPQSVLILKSAATGGAVLTGSAEVTSDSAISGFVIFSYTPTGQDVLVPLSSTAASSYSMAFDNTGGLSTGIAIASSSTTAITVGITAVDENGQQLINSTPVSIHALGHSSFVMGTQIPALANHRGTLVFTPTSGQQISLVGIRATSAGALTGIPVLASGSTGSGILPDLAVGGGWSTLIELVNGNSISSQAHIRFYGDDGSQLSLPVSSSDLGISDTTSAIDKVLLPNSSALIQSTSSDALVGGSARLTSDPGVTGFLIFQYSTGENVLVNAQGSNASSYLVPFDQTNGLSTGISLANTTTQAIQVVATLRDQNGQPLGSQSSIYISLPPQGHQSFVLTSIFPAAAGNYGTVTFTPGSGQQIGVLGIRYTPTGAFTSIPVLTP